MAPELRKRKSLTETKPNGTSTTAVEKTATKSKRKAPEGTSEASPVSLKKQKAVKKTAVQPKATKKSAPKSEKKKPDVEEKVEVVEEEEQTIDVPEESDSNAEEEENKQVEALANQLDSEDEDMTTGDDTFKTGQDVGKVPKVSKKVQKDAKQPDGEPGVIYIGRIPHGFYEHEMRQYFEQFGTINKLRLSRNKTTGASKHFAFVEFAEAATADIVAKTMDNYLLFGHILKCRTIPKDQIRDDLFKGANRRFKKVPWNKMEGLKLQKPLTESTWADKVSKEQSKRAKKAAKLKELGYEFEAPEIKEVPVPAMIENGEAEVKDEAKAVEATPAVEDKAEEAVVEEKVTVKKAAGKKAASKKAAEVEVEAEVEAEVEVEIEPETEVTTIPKTKAKGAKGAKGKAAKGKKAKA